MLTVLDRLAAARVDPLPLAAARIAAGLAALVLAVDTRSALRRIAGPSVVQIPVTDWLPEPSRGLADAVAVAWVVAGCLLLTGVLARAGAATAAALSLFVLGVDEQTYSNHLVLMLASGALLAMARPGAALSPWARRHGRRPVPYWPLFLLKTQITTLYAWTVVAKLNPSYFSDQPLRFGVNASLRDLPDGVFLAAGLLVLAAEAFLAVALWFRASRTAAFAVGVALHGAIMVLGSSPVGLVPFGLLTLGPYPLFLQDPLWGRGGVALERAARPVSRKVVPWH